MSRESSKIRSTITLDEDVAALIAVEVRRTGRGFEEVVNDMVRLGFSLRPRPTDAGRFVVQARPMGLPSELSFDNIEALLEDLEGPSHR